MKSLESDFLSDPFPFLGRNSKKHHIVMTKSNASAEPMAASKLFMHGEQGKMEAEEEAKRLNHGLFHDRASHTMDEGGYEVHFLERRDFYFRVPRDSNPYV